MKNGIMRGNIRQFRKKCKWIFSDEGQIVKRANKKA